jgi:glucose-6-phosphate 1-epimerase
MPYRSGPPNRPAGSPGEPLTSLTLRHPSGGVVVIYSQGAHVASWRPAEGEEVLFMSRHTRLETGVPIRGGIPVVFPQFSDRGPLPKHGFARTLPWEVVESGSDAAGAACARLRLSDTGTTRELWPHLFLAELLVTLDDGLSTSLRVTNTGDRPFTFTSALHTYYDVGDVRGVTVRGLEGSRYLGMTPGEAPREVRGSLRIEGETDGVYAGVGDRLHIGDSSRARTLVIDKAGFADAVVWNPWIEKARSLPDFGDEEYLEMLCVEPANIDDPTHLAPGQEWTGTQRIRVRQGT